MFSDFEYNFFNFSMRLIDFLLAVMMPIFVCLTNETQNSDDNLGGIRGRDSCSKTYSQQERKF